MDNLEVMRNRLWHAGQISSVERMLLTKAINMLRWGVLFKPHRMYWMINKEAKRFLNTPSPFPKDSEADAGFKAAQTLFGMYIDTEEEFK